MSELSPFFVNKAKKELGEDETKKRQSLTLFKKWLERHPFIKMHTIDEIHLLMHLRRSKYVNEKAFQSFEDMRVFEKSHPEWLDIPEKDLDEFAKNTHTCIRTLKRRDKEGQRVVVLDCRQQLDISLSEYMRYSQNFFNAIVLEEETQIAGITYIFECSNVKFSYFRKIFLPVTLYQFFSQMKSYPIRIKQVNVVGMPAYGVVMYELIRNFFSKKLKSRLNVVKSTSDLSKVMDTSDLLLDDQSDYNYEHFVPIDESIKRATRFYHSYEIDFEQMRRCKKNKTPIIITPPKAAQELGFD